MPVIRTHFEFRDTFATIIAEEEDHIKAAKGAMVQARQEIERYIAEDPQFLTSFFPISVRSESSVVMKMGEAAKSAGTGPMAAVAGTIAWCGCRAMVEAGAVYGIIDNGGDIALVSDRPVCIGLYTGTHKGESDVAFVLPPQKRIYGVCTSSATVGHSISLGIADSVTVFSSDPAFADAYATTLCNQIRPDCISCFEMVPDIIHGVYCVAGDWQYSYGAVPPQARAQVQTDTITKNIVYKPGAVR